MEETKVITAETVEAVEIVEPVETQKPYTFRRLNAEDVFLMFNVISKIGVKEIKEAFEDEDVIKTISNMASKNGAENGKDALYTVGVSVIVSVADIVLKNIGKCKNDLYALLGQVSNMEARKIAELDAVVFIEMVIDFFKKPEFPDFFKVVSKLFK